MKKNIYLIVAILFLALIVLSTVNKPKAVEPAGEEVAQQPLPEMRELCYIWNTEALDKATLRMQITNGTEVAGNFAFLPFEKDKRTGSIEGTAGPVDRVAMARTAKLWWTVSGEGVTNKEELFVNFGEGTAYVGFGEMKDRGDGVYVYSDPSNISFDPPMNQTNCDDPAVL